MLEEEKVGRGESRDRGQSLRKGWVFQKDDVFGCHTDAAMGVWISGISSKLVGMGETESKTGARECFLGKSILGGFSTRRGGKKEKM